MIGQRASFDNSATVEVLGWDPTPIETSVRDMAALDRHSRRLMERFL